MQSGLASGRPGLFVPHCSAVDEGVIPWTKGNKMADGEQVPSKAFPTQQRKALGLTASEKAEMYRPIVFVNHQWKFKVFTALVSAGASVGFLLAVCVYVRTYVRTYHSYSTVPPCSMLC